jgi:hypothetical protein
VVLLFAVVGSSSFTSNKLKAHENDMKPVDGAQQMVSQHKLRFGDIQRKLRILFYCDEDERQFSGN